MPSKTVPSWTQVPVTAAELVSIYYSRLPASQLNVEIGYEIKDNLGAVRGTKSLRQTIALAAFPLSAATILASCNTAEGT